MILLGVGRGPPIGGDARVADERPLAQGGATDRHHAGLTAFCSMAYRSWVLTARTRSRTTWNRRSDRAIVTKALMMRTRRMGRLADDARVRRRGGSATATMTSLDLARSAAVVMPPLVRPHACDHPNPACIRTITSLFWRHPPWPGAVVLPHLRHARRGGGRWASPVGIVCGRPSWPPDAVRSAAVTLSG